MASPLAATSPGHLNIPCLAWGGGGRSAAGWVSILYTSPSKFWSVLEAEITSAANLRIKLKPWPPAVLSIIS